MTCGQKKVWVTLQNLRFIPILRSIKNVNLFHIVYTVPRKIWNLIYTFSENLHAAFSLHSPSLLGIMQLIACTDLQSPFSVCSWSSSSCMFVIRIFHIFSHLTCSFLFHLTLHVVISPVILSVLILPHLHLSNRVHPAKGLQVLISCTSILRSS